MSVADTPKAKGLRVVRPRTKRDFEWVALLDMTDVVPAGVGDTEEEAAVALLSSVLESVLERFRTAEKYGAVRSEVVRRVADLNAKFVCDLRKLHRTVLDEAARRVLFEDEWAVSPEDRGAVVAVTEDDVGDDFL